MKWNTLHFDKLSARQFHDIVALRISVFVVEQACPYPELDGKDLKSYHVFGIDEKNETLACARIVPPGISYDEVSIGRVCTCEKARGTGAGRELMKETMASIETLYGKVPVRISAQEYLLKFYESFGFIKVSESYLEDDIPHVEMLYTPR